ncbi:MAG: SMC-Scp complex subunit ScpB [Peptoniphilaceae bacterium]|nr:SMC-Scp complex subunit ScpB [Peptoniphilaceae bacterium]MDY6019386.1 SMC-Scp complex subunit ScpB [Anaerococcus sp.]
MDKDYLKGIIEEILYIWADPIDLDDLSKIIYDFDKKDIKICLEEMIKERKEKNSGLLIKVFDGRFQFVTRKKHEKYMEKLVKSSPKKLTNSAMETLSIIAYKQPITRAEIDKIRGMNSQSTIDSLITKGLIKENGRLDKIGKPIIYVTTSQFLRYFDIESLDQLPEIEYVDLLEEDDKDEN